MFIGTLSLGALGGKTDKTKTHKLNYFITQQFSTKYIHLYAWTEIWQSTMTTTNVTQDNWKIDLCDSTYTTYGFSVCQLKFEQKQKGSNYLRSPWTENDHPEKRSLFGCIHKGELTCRRSWLSKLQKKKPVFVQSVLKMRSGWIWSPNLNLNWKLFAKSWWNVFQVFRETKAWFMSRNGKSIQDPLAVNLSPKRISLWRHFSSWQCFPNL